MSGRRYSRARKLVRLQLDTPGYLPGEAARRPKKLAHLYAEAWRPGSLMRRIEAHVLAYPARKTDPLRKLKVD